MNCLRRAVFTARCTKVSFQNKMPPVKEASACKNLVFKTIVSRIFLQAKAKAQNTLSPFFIIYYSPKLIPIFLAVSTTSLSMGTALSLPAISSRGTAATLLFTSATILP